ncbi:MAG: AlwI family type II restriction endonuclease [Bacteroidales bacterium]|nr:AlwI family type II restriction endonuclease [Bacteroidales bacterium]
MKPWSISTTVRNPERIRNFLVVLKDLEGNVWDTDTQRQFQVLLLKNRLYGVYEPQFYVGLTHQDIDLLESDMDISYQQAEAILERKNYVGGIEMRGRQSINPLKKMGFVYEDGKKLKFTEFGNLFLDPNYDLGDIFFRSFIKWQLPNPTASDFSRGYNIKPFIATLHLIDQVNTLCHKQNQKAKGITKLEFQLFCLTLFDYTQIEAQAKKLLLFRKGYDASRDKEVFVQQYIADNLKNISGVNNLADYADNAIRYFRLTRYVCLRGGGYYVDLEPRRQVEIENLLRVDNASPVQFDSPTAYYAYMDDPDQPELPWENLAENRKIATLILSDIEAYCKELHTSVNIPDQAAIAALGYNQLKNLISQLRVTRSNLQRQLEHDKAQSIEEATNCRNALTAIRTSRNKNKKSVELEHLCTIALNALDDAIEIRPNYPVGDDNEPTFTAPANRPDIECYYSNFNVICEVTMLSDRQQWFNEGQPVMRHLYDFEQAHSDKRNYCLFIAPSLHRDTANVYWGYRKIGYEGTHQNIVPLTIDQFVGLIDTLILLKKRGNKLSCRDIVSLYDTIVDSADKSPDATAWVASIAGILTTWKQQLLS